MEKDQITRLALRDAANESDENLRAAGRIYDGLTNHGRPSQSNLIQDDIWGTPLPNGMLKWFGYDFDRVELPEDPVLRGGDPPQWVGTLPGFTYRTGISDARITVETDGFKNEGDEEEEETRVTPERYTIAVRAHGFDRDQEAACPDWHQVQQTCRSIERQLDETYHERHNLCQDEEGETTADACSFCERG